MVEKSCRNMEGGVEEWSGNYRRELALSKNHGLSGNYDRPGGFARGRQVAAGVAISSNN